MGSTHVGNGERVGRGGSGLEDTGLSRSLEIVDFNAASASRPHAPDHGCGANHVGGILGAAPREGDVSLPRAFYRKVDRRVCIAKDECQ